MNKGAILLDGLSLSISDVVNVAREGYRVGLSEDAAREVNAAAGLVKKWASSSDVVYGITTGFGAIMI